MKSTTVYFSLGSNDGDRVENLRGALKELASFVKIIKVSGLYETKPMYVTEQPLFINAAVAAECRIDPFTLLKSIHNIEECQGRNRSRETRYGPRTLDIDIIQYGEKILYTRNLTVPHPKITERQFVLVPLTEIEPELRHPELGISYRSINSELFEQGVCTYMLETL